MKKRLLHILFWSVISAAFIGPGTVTTAASAGAGFGYSLIWALIFSTAACYVLQEASARITAASGLNLGEAMRQQYSHSMAGKGLIMLSLVAILSGCIAFEAGNILGAVAGVEVITGSIPVSVIVSVIGLIAAVILWNGTVKQIATVLGLIVAVMGICFVITALLIPHDIGEMFMSGFKPEIPAGAEILVLGLIGTTVVPYNIFLGSGLRHTQTVSEMKTSLMIAIGLGGFVSIAILLTGTAISGVFTFEALADALSERIGIWGEMLLGIGLFGAGISSALTAALAASVTAKSLLAASGSDQNWAENRLRFRLVWMIVLATGLVFGVIGLQPVPVIIFAQALNGIILPVIAVVLFLLMNNQNVLKRKFRNGRFYNALTALVVYLTILIGITNVLRAASRVFDFSLPGQLTITVMSLLIFLIIMVPVMSGLLQSKSGGKAE